MLDFAADISRLQNVRNRKVLSTSRVIVIRWRQPRLLFCDMKLTLFCVSTASGLLHDVFQYVSAHPIPIEICYGMLSPRLPFYDMKLTFFCVSTASGLLHDVFQDVSAFPSPLKFVMECSATQRILTHFLFVFVCRGWVHPVSVTMRSPPIPLFCFLSVPKGIFVVKDWKGL